MQLLNANIRGISVRKEWNPTEIHNGTTQTAFSYVVPLVTEAISSVHTEFLCRKWILSSRTTIVFEQKLKTTMLMSSSSTTTRKRPPRWLRSRCKMRTNRPSSSSRVTCWKSPRGARPGLWWAWSLPRIQTRGSLLSGTSGRPALQQGMNGHTLTCL